MNRPLVVMKFGGTSVADPERMQRAAERAVREHRKGARVVVVVSAPGHMTDDLLGLAARICPDPDPRELDVLVSTGEMVAISLFAMACRSYGVPATSLSGPQAGFKAAGRHTDASITRIDPTKIRRLLTQRHIVPVAGFQASNPGGDVTTLGRGGSDLSAVALAARLKADRCEVFTDVRGVYSADPRIVPQARMIGRISYEEMLELSAAGAQVMQARSIEVAKIHHVPIHVRSAFHSGPGTLITSRKGGRMEKANISGLAVHKGEVRVSLVGVPDRPGTAAKVLAALAKASVPADLIVQSAPTTAGVNEISFLAPRAKSQLAEKALKPLAKKLGAARVDVYEGVVKLTAVGTGFRRDPKVAATLFEALAKARINIQMISSSDLRVSCVIDRRHADKALRAAHTAFKLGKKR